MVTTLLRNFLTLVPPRLREQRGQAMVEFAIVLPLLLLVILGILYFGRYESYSNQMTQLSEQGARDAAVNFTSYGSSANLASYIQSQATGEIAAGNGNVQQVSVRVDCNSNVAGASSSTPCTQNNNVTVCLQSVVQFPGLGINAGTVYQQATMRIEQTSTSITDVTAGPNPPSC